MVMETDGNMIRIAIECIQIIIDRGDDCGCGSFAGDTLGDGYGNGNGCCEISWNGDGMGNGDQPQMERGNGTGKGAGSDWNGDGETMPYAGMKNNCKVVGNTGGSTI
jgi:hypothetical protein